MENTYIKLVDDILNGNFANAILTSCDEKFDPNEQTKSGQTMLSAIVQKIRFDAPSLINDEAFKSFISTIIDHKNFEPNKRGTMDETPLMTLCRYPECAWVVEMLLEHPDTNINLRSRFGNTAEDIARMQDNDEALKLIFKKKVKNHVVKAKKRNPAERKLAKNALMLSHIEGGFRQIQKENETSIYWLIKSFLMGDYEAALSIARSKDFNATEEDYWGEPVIYSLIYYSQDKQTEYDEGWLKKIIDAIFEHKTFNINQTDADGNNILMVSIQFKKLNWLSEKLIENHDLKIDIKNEMGYGLIDVATAAHQEEFLSSIIAKHAVTVE